MFIDPGRFDFTARLEASWRDVRAEFDRLRPDDFFDWHETEAYSGAWKLCGVHANDHPDADKLDPDVVRRCPVSVELAKSVPTLRWAAFSVLGPGTIIHPHTDTPEGEVEGCRAHLGLKIPPDRIFRMGEVDGGWEEGRVLAFRGMMPHAVWNHSADWRAVLVFDFLPDRAA